MQSATTHNLKLVGSYRFDKLAKAFRVAQENARLERIATRRRLHELTKDADLPAHLEDISLSTQEGGPF